MPKEVCVTVAVPLGLSKKIVKRSLCNSRCAMGIRDAENLEEGYMAHTVPLVFGANFFLKSTNISLCAMSRLDLVTFWFSVGCRRAIGIATKWCDFPPCDVTFPHLAFPLGDVTFLRLMWRKPGACNSGLKISGELYDMQPMISGDYEVGTGHGVPGKESATGEPNVWPVFPFSGVGNCWELFGTC